MLNTQGTQDRLTLEEQQVLLRTARQAMEYGVRHERIPPVDEAALPSHLRENGASFVTLTIRGELRGCIGGLEPRQSLIQDVREHAVAAALDDPRFPPVEEGELSRIQIEVSRLTDPLLLHYTDADDLLSKLRPHVDGVILRDGFRRATFLPQVWEKIPDCTQFLNHLCWKMGAEENAWRKRRLEVFTYQVEEFRESPNE